MPPPDSPDYPIPAQKSLFGDDTDSGLPIGNLTSQFWGNVYLNELDQFVKRRLRCRHYLRYVDDMVLVDRDPKRLRAWRVEIEKFLADKLLLWLRADTQPPYPVEKGVTFVGWKTWWSHRVPRRRTIGKLKRRIARFERREVRRFEQGKLSQIGLARRGRHERDSVGELRASLAACAGHLQHGAAIREWKHLWLRWPWMGALFERDGWWIGARWPEARVGSRKFKSEYRRLIKNSGDDVLVFLRMGRFIEFYGAQRLRAQATLGLNPIRLPRAGYALTAGFPVWMTDRYCRRALRAGCGVVFATRRREGCFPEAIATGGTWCAENY